MINARALEILGGAIAEATAIQADYIVINPEIGGLISREQLANNEIMEYLKYISGAQAAE